MSDFEPVLPSIKETFCDKEPPEIRTFILGFILSKDVFLPNGFMPKEAVKGDVLDLGCGRGSLGAALKVINEEINLVGVDIVEYEGEGFREKYSEIRKNDAVKELEEIRRKGQKFDLVISCGLPGGVVEMLVEKGDLIKIVKPDGFALLIFDDPMRANFYKKAEKSGFVLYNGAYPVDSEILCWHNSPEQKIEV